MSDIGRKGLGDQVQEKVTPDSQKSTLDQAKESASGAYDRVAGAAQPGKFHLTSSPSTLHYHILSKHILTIRTEQDKSATQKLGDSTRSGGDQGKGMMESAKDSISNTFGGGKQ
jgi:hypothetical protein